MNPVATTITAFLGAFLLAAAAAAEAPLEALAPVLVVDAGRSPTTRQVDAVAAGLGAPVIRGARLARVLIETETRPPTYDRAALAGDLAAAEDLFFAGEGGAAGERFDRIVRTVEGDPCALALDPDQRRIGFKARLYLASIAHSDGNDTEVGEILARAAALYPELSPESGFAPWLRQAHAAAAASAEPTGQPRCDLSLSAGGPVVGVDRSDVRITVDPGGSTDDLAPGLLAICRSGGWPRLVAVIGRPHAVEIALIDEDGRVARSERVSAGEPAALGDAADRLVSAAAGGDQSLDEADAPRTARPAVRAPWYADGLAWAVTGVGLAIAGTGFALGRAYGSPSTQEPAAWALMVSGAAVAGTGLVLFIVPERAEEPGDPAAGAAFGVSGSFTF